MNKVRIAGVVVLYNPNQEVIENIKSYINEIDCLFVIDNSEVSNDVIVEELQKHDKILYLPHYENKGIAYSLNEAAAEAIKNGFQYLLTMDQDSSVNQEMIKIMIESCVDEKQVGIIAPYYIDKMQPEKKNEKERQYILCEKTSGNLLNLSAFKKVGKFNEDYFIDYVDIEYGFKLNLNGWKVIKVNLATIYHNEGELSARTFFFKKVHPYNYPPVRYYYRTRNLLYLRSRYKNKLPIAVRNEVKVYLKNVIKALLYEKDKIKKIKMIIKGFRDYTQGIVGRINIAVPNDRLYGK